MTIHAVVTMSLSFEVPQAHFAAAQAAFAESWPASSAAQWCNMDVSASSDADFLNKLNIEFVTNLKSLSPVPVKSAWTLDPPFSAASGWRVGSGGLHEMSNTITYEEGGMLGRQWYLTYNYNGLHNAYVRVIASWSPYKSL
jgi:hypothetical protein